jgi:uncharacterized protein YkwD
MRRVSVVAGVLLLLTAPARALTVDSQDRGAVAALYDTVYLASEGVPSGYTGDYAICAPGDVSAAYRDAGLRRIAYFRAMAGLPSEITWRADWDAKCQEAALMMTANRQLSHSPPTSWTCYSTGGAEAAGRSNLAGGYATLPAAVTGWILDGSVPSAGHRRWILYPPAQSMGVGATFGNSYPAYALWVIGGAGTRPPAPEWVAWPPAGYVPYQTVGPLWSFAYPGADFSAATVALTRDGAAASVRLEIVANGYGDNTLCWTVLDYAGGKPAHDVRHHVAVGNVRVGGVPRAFDYDVVVFDPASTPGTPVEGPSPAAPVRLVAVVPNPFTVTTAIRYELPADAEVTLAVYDVSGRRVAELVRGCRPAGSHAVGWDGHESSGARAAPGVYMVRLQAGGATVACRLLLLR